MIHCVLGQPRDRRKRHFLRPAIERDESCTSSNVLSIRGRVSVRDHNSQHAEKPSQLRRMMWIPRGPRIST